MEYTLPTCSKRISNAIDDDQKIMLEPKLPTERIAEWFSTFVQHTDQKRITGQVFNILLQQLKEEQWKNNPLVLDIGFGEGGLSSLVAKALIETYPSLSYSGIEQNKEFLSNTADKLREVGLNDINLVLGNCFSEDLNKLPNEAHIILASHVAYYTSGIEQFVESLIQKIANNGVAIFIHESADSDMNILRKKYCNSININSNEKVCETLAGMNNQYSVITINSKLEFPKNIDELWLELRKYCANIRYKSLDNFELVKNLLEFVVQTPLEFLHDSNQLDLYLKDIRSLLSKQNNILIVRTEMQLALSKNVSKEFRNTVSEISNEVEQKLCPSPIIHEFIQENNKD